MPYATNTELPENIRSALPRHAQDIFRAAFNDAYQRYGSNEARAFRIAWCAVKRSYVRRRVGLWVPRRVRAGGRESVARRRRRHAGDARTVEQLS